MEVNCETLAVMGATLANGGVCPTTSEVAINPEAVRDVLSLMHSCGMYNYSGQFAFNVSFSKYSQKCFTPIILMLVKLPNDISKLN